MALLSKAILKMACEGPRRDYRFATLKKTKPPKDNKHHFLNHEALALKTVTYFFQRLTPGELI